MLFDILINSISSVIWGILISIICMTLFFLLIKGCYKDATLSPISYVTGAVLFLLLSFQCILIVGSCKIISTTGEYEKDLKAIVDSYGPDEMLDQEEAAELIQKFIDAYPVLGHYVTASGEYYGSVRELPHTLVNELHTMMYWYIFRRILWCLGFTIVAAIIVVKSLSRPYVPRRRVATVSHDRRRVSRRPRR